MNNVYYRDLMEILLPCGSRGMKLNQIVRRVYNIHTDLFNMEMNYDELYRMMGYYLWHQSERRESPFQRVTFGVYAIKPDVAVQLDLFWDLTQEELSDAEEEPTLPDCSGHIQMELF